MAVNDVFQVTVVGAIHAQTTLNVFHYRTSIAGTDTDILGAIANTFQTVTSNAWQNCTSDEFEIIGYAVQKILPLPISNAFTKFVSVVGLVAGDALPSSMAAVITKRTLLGGAANRGRTYLAGVPLSFEVNSTISNAGLTLIQALGDKLDDNLVTAGNTTLEPVILHRQTNTVTPIKSTLARVVLRNQRRRQVGRGF